MIEPSIWKSNIYGFHHRINEHLHSEGFKPCENWENGTEVYDLVINNHYRMRTVVTVYNDKLSVLFDGDSRKSFLFDKTSYESFINAYNQVIWLLEEQT